MEAGRRLQEAMRLWTEVGAPYECAQSRMGLGAAFRAQGNEPQAVLEFHAARSTFERLGAEIDVRRAARAAGDTKPSAGPRMERVFMFTDIVESTNLAEVIGDEAWGHLVRWHNDVLASLVAGQGGEIVRTTGDGIFATFEDPESAIACAMAIQRTLEEHRREQGFSPKVRIGLHRRGRSAPRTRSARTRRVIADPDRLGDTEAPVPFDHDLNSGPTVSRTARTISSESLRSHGLIVRQADPNGSNLSALYPRATTSAARSAKLSGVRGPTYQPLA